MSRTYRWGDARKWRMEHRTEGDVPDGARPGDSGGAYAGQPETITPEWALERMNGRIIFAVNSLVEAEFIPADERDDCEQAIRIRVARAVSRYDARRQEKEFQARKLAGELREGQKPGRECSAITFLQAVIDHTRINVIRSYARSAGFYRDVRPAGAEPDVKSPDGKKPEIGDGTTTESPHDEERFGDGCADSALSDGCLSLRRLVWALDMATIRSMLTPRQRSCLGMMLAGVPKEKVEDEIGLFGGTFYRKVVHPIRRVLRKCGYGPNDIF